MPRRTATLLASVIVLVVLLGVTALIPVPYAEMGPGPTVNTLGKDGKTEVLQISGHRTYPTSGNLNMTTVQVTGQDYRMDLFEAVRGWLQTDADVVPKKVLYPSNLSTKEINQQNAEEFQDSQESAKTAALKELGIPVGTQIIVKSVVNGEPADGKLNAGDAIVAVDGHKVTETSQVAAYITKHKPGGAVRFTIRPDGAEKKDAPEKTVSVKTAKAPDGGRAIVGITPGESHTYPFDINIKLADVGGPSAGLMFSLGLIDKLQPTNLTGGKFIAGTGTIDDNGTVGEIGGITMKIIAARRAGAQYFLTPAGNCAAAADAKPDGLTLVKVGTLDNAMTALKAIRSGDAGALTQCQK
ncbi:PDZ/DHR/GLGF domain-containing protein [Mangrovactinospora gilvigrisea]|uniref:endopeptidase La n=1 Tax=Mangrovactinospora gilvigrisea TaxID=1428644 RepID=A0A1J7BUQ3_9ACTN|nr:PDZ domain-containing protein [Mangrovactinospora gilvigrisea]OIV37201.1 PDZ/DHR/GLGF domain-containing protein [Mangrovactinospora gilvigrisea]